MARAKRHYVPGQVWHITHRCHKREFLLKFKQDRRRWIQWLFEAKRRFGLVVLNYAVTSNHNRIGMLQNKLYQVLGRDLHLFYISFTAPWHSMPFFV